MQRMCAAGDLSAYKRILRMKGVGIHLFQRVPACIVISVTGGSCHVFCGHTAFLHSAYYFQLVFFGRPIDGLETVF